MTTSQFVFRALAAGAALLISATPAASTAASTDDTSTKVLTIKGRTFTTDQVTSYVTLLQQTEGADISPDVLIEELALQYGIDVVFTTVPKAVKPEVKATRYATVSQRALLKTLLRDHVQSEIEVSREEMEQWFEKNGKSYESPERVQARHLFMQTSEDEETSAPAKVRARIEEVLKKLREGETFADLATTYSEAASSAFGGNIGWVSWRQPIGPESKPMNEKLESALFKLDSGEVSDIIETRHGLHLMYAEQHLTTSTPTLDDLITSGIMPGALKGTKMRDAMTQAMNDAIEKHGGKIFETSDTEELTTETKAVAIAGRVWTIADAELVFGERFTRAFTRARRTPQAIDQLLRQLLEDEAMVQSAIDAGLDKSPEVKEQLELLAAREGFQKRMNDIIASGYPVTDDAVKKRYEQEKHQFLQPEAEGHVITIPIDTSSTEPADMAKAADEAQKIANELREKLTSSTVEEIEKAAQELSSDNRASSGGVVERHVIGSLTDEAGRQFDASISSLTKEGSWSNVRAIANGYVFGRLGKRYEGEPAPLEQVRGRIVNRLQFEQQQEARTDILRMLEDKGILKWLPGAEPLGKMPTASASKQD